MMEFSMLDPMQLSIFEQEKELCACNEMTARFGLCLTDDQIHALVRARSDSLRNTGRIEFGEGVLKKLIYAFCDSPHLSNADYGKFLLELQDLFYSYKNESDDLIADDELIESMKRMYEGEAHGELEYLAGTSLEELCRRTRSGEEQWDAAYGWQPFGEDV